MLGGRDDRHPDWVARRDRPVADHHCVRLPYEVCCLGGRTAKTHRLDGRDRKLGGRDGPVADHQYVHLPYGVFWSEGRPAKLIISDGRDEKIGGRDGPVADHQCAQLPSPRQPTNRKSDC